MTRPADEQPTTVLPQQTVEQPSVTTSPATRRSGTWHSRIPARIGRARSSTVIIGALFVLLGGLNVTLPQEDSGTTPVVLPSGKTIEVSNSEIPTEDRAPTTPAGPGTPTPTDDGPAPTSAQPTGTRAPSSTPTDEGTETTPAPTSTPRSTPTTSAPAPSSSERTSATPTTRAPSTSAGTPTEEPAPTGTADPTG